MKSMDYWQLFLETGAPEAYLMYSKQLKAEADYVFNNPGTCSASHQLQ